MMQFFPHRVTCLVLLAVATQAEISRAQPPERKTQTYVGVTALAEKPLPNGRQAVVVNLHIAKGCPILANPVGNEDFESARLRIEIHSAGIPLETEVAYPPAETIKEELIGDYKVYRGKVSIRVSAKRSSESDEPLEVRV